jgi:hypothetical protein
VKPFLTKKTGTCIACGKSFTFMSKTRYVRMTCSTKCAHEVQVASIRETDCMKYEYEPPPEEIAAGMQEIRQKRFEMDAKEEARLVAAKKAKVAERRRNEMDLALKQFKERLKDA